ncbi:MAG: MopE-related protein, partial [Polyangiaceae bacterium]
GIDSDCGDDSDYDADTDGYDHDGYGGSDCNDSDGAIHPGASETWYDGVDGNCDDRNDHDADSDGHLHPSYGGDDCDDAVGSTYPGASDTWYDGVDSNCDGANDYDADSDGHNHSSHGGDDCDDACSTCYPGSTHYTESPDGRNQDCDSEVDELDGAAMTKVCNAPGASAWHRVDSEYGGLQRACRAFCGHDAFSISGCNTGGGCFGSMWSEYNFSTCTPSGGYTGCPNGGMDWSCPFSCTCREAYR